MRCLGRTSSIVAPISVARTLISPMVCKHTRQPRGARCIVKLTGFTPQSIQVGGVVWSHVDVWRGVVSQCAASAFIEQ